MPTDENPIPEKAQPMNPGNYSPVTVIVEDTLGALFLGILACICLIGWMHTETRYRALMTQWEMTNGNGSIDTR